MTSECPEGYVGYLPSSFQRSSAKDLSQGSQALRNDVAEYLKKLADRVNKCKDNESFISREFDGTEPSNGEILADKENVLLDIKEKLGAVERTFDEVEDVVENASKVGSDLCDRFWDSILTLECTLRFITSHFMRLDDSPTDRLESGSATPLSCVYLAKLSNVCTRYVDRLNDILLKDAMRLKDGEAPCLLPRDDIAFYNEEGKAWMEMFKNEPKVIVIRKLIHYNMRIKRIQLRMDAILTHISPDHEIDFLRCAIRHKRCHGQYQHVF